MWVYPASGDWYGLVHKAQRRKVTSTGDGFHTVADTAGRQPLRVADGQKGRAWGAGVSLGR